MRNRIENGLLIIFFGLTTLLMMKLIIYIIDFSQTIRIDTSGLAAMV